MPGRVHSRARTPNASVCSSVSPGASAPVVRRFYTTESASPSRIVTLKVKVPLLSNRILYNLTCVPLIVDVILFVLSYISYRFLTIGKGLIKIGSLCIAIWIW